jgi:O-antigen ligase
MLLFAIVTVIAIVVTSVPQLGDSIIQSLRGIIDPYSDANASWRIEGWKQQLDSIFNQNFLFGAGVGGYYHWVNKGAIVRSSPHNGYIQLILKFGLLGLLMYGLLAFGFFRKTLAMRKQLPPGPLRAFVEVGIVNFGAAHGYLTGYGFSPIMLIVFALALGAVKLADSARMSPKMGRTSEAEHEHERGPCSLEFL